MSAATEIQQVEKTHKSILRSGAQIHVVSLDEIVDQSASDQSASDQKLRLADIAFPPAYEAESLRALKALSAVNADIITLSATVDYLGRIPVRITHSKTDGDRVSGGGKYDWADHLLSQGLALLMPESGQDIGHLIKTENEAIKNRQGLWADRGTKSAYFVLANDVHQEKTNIGGVSDVPDVADAIGRFVVVDGILKSIEHQKWRSYLNFGSDWRSDFTIALGHEIRQGFVGGEISQDHLVEWIGRKIRVRGVVENRGGPYIALRNPDWLCVEMD